MRGLFVGAPLLSGDRSHPESIASGHGAAFTLPIFLPAAGHGARPAQYHARRVHAPPAPCVEGSETTLNGEMIMRKLSLAAACCAALVASGSVLARDDKLMLPIQAAMTQPKAAETLGTDVRFYFGNSAHPAAARTLGTYTSNKKTNGVGKSDEQACNWAFLSAMIALRDRALAEGGNAVVNIESYYKKNTFSSTTEYECHAGNIMSGVALRGQVVKL